jgi:alkylation response protein AidB-like acyl-CoA dehydrogenase
MTMANYFTDNQDIQFYLEHLEVDRIAAIMEDDFAYGGKFDGAPDGPDDAIEGYKSILESIGDIAGNRIAPTAAETDEIGNTLNEDGTVTYAPGIAQAIELLSQAGMMGFTLPYRYGGLNCPNLVYTMSIDVISRADASLMNLYGLQGIAETINAFADEELKEQYLPAMASGQATGAMVLTEPEAGSDLQSVKVRADQDENGQWRINGVKRFITNGCGHILLVLARSEPDIQDGRGLSLFLVERDPTVQVRRLENKMGIHGSPTCELYFENTPAKLVGERQQGLIRYVMALMYGARMGVAAQSLGIGEAAYRVARSYADSRKQFGTSIDHFPAIRELLVDSKVDLTAARALTYYASFCVDLDYGLQKKLAEPDKLDPAEKKEIKSQVREFRRVNGMLTPMAKYWSSEMCLRVANNSISVLGGSGYMRDYPVERLFRDARITSIYEGTSQLQIVAAVSGVMGGGADAVIDHLLEGEFPASLQSRVEQVRKAQADLHEIVEYVKGVDDQNYRRLYARRITDCAIYAIVGAILVTQVRTSDERLAVLDRWISVRFAELEMNKQLILSGDDITIREFERLAGPVPELA